MYGDAYRPPTQFSVFPPVLKNLLIINGLIFLAQMPDLLNSYLVEWFALWPIGTEYYAPSGRLVEVAGFWPWQLLTYGFLHSTTNLMHIVFNMFMLWMFGVQIENVMGSRRFLTYYLFCVFGAGLLQLAAGAYELMGAPPGLGYPTLGASGGVMGILLAFGMLFPNQPIYLYFLVPIPAKYLVMGLAAFELFAGVSGNQPGVANFAHLGGMIFGVLLILFWRGKLPVLPKERIYY